MNNDDDVPNITHSSVIAKQQKLDELNRAYEREIEGLRRFEGLSVDRQRAVAQVAEARQTLAALEQEFQHEHAEERPNARRSRFGPWPGGGDGVWGSLFWGRGMIGASVLPEFSSGLLIASGGCWEFLGPSGLLGNYWELLVVSGCF